MANGNEPDLVQINLDPRLARRLRRWFWTASVTGIALLLAYWVRDIWIPLAIAFLIAMVLDPVVDRMERRGYSRTLATVLIYVGAVAVIGVILYLGVPAMVRQATAISDQLTQYLPTPGNQDRAERSLRRMLDESRLPPYARNAIQRGAEQVASAVTSSLRWFSAHAMEVLSNLIWVIIIPIVTFYALRDFHLIFAKGLLLVPRQQRDFVQSMVGEVTTIFAKFLRGLMLVSFLNGFATWIVLMLLGVPNALMLGVIAGLLYSIPYLGAIGTIVLIAGVAFIAPGGGLNFMIVVVAVNILLHQVVFDQIISPRILGGHVGLHPILSIIALLAGNSLLGILGMILAVPVAASIQIVIVTLVPKLSQEIELPASIHEPAESVEQLEAATKEEHIVMDATEQLHRSVGEAVEAAEARVEAEQNGSAESVTPESVTKGRA
jgi:predicted PurR-regulated permease PerM